MVDSIFVSRVSENALNAVSLAFPVQNLMIAVATGFSSFSSIVSLLSSFGSKCLTSKKSAATGSGTALNSTFMGSGH